MGICLAETLNYVTLNVQGGEARDRFQAVIMAFAFRFNKFQPQRES